MKPYSIILKVIEPQSKKTIYGCDFERSFKEDIDAMHFGLFMLCQNLDEDKEELFEPEFIYKLRIFKYDEKYEDYNTLLNMVYES